MKTTLDKDGTLICAEIMYERAPDDPKGEKDAKQVPCGFQAHTNSDGSLSCDRGHKGVPETMQPVRRRD